MMTILDIEVLRNIKVRKWENEIIKKYDITYYWYALSGYIHYIHISISHATSRTSANKDDDDNNNDSNNRKIWISNITTIILLWYWMENYIHEDMRFPGIHMAVVWMLVNGRESFYGHNKCSWTNVQIIYI